MTVSHVPGTLPEAWEEGCPKTDVDPGGAALHLFRNVTQPWVVRFSEPFSVSQPSKYFFGS